MEKVLIVGKNGLLGAALYKELSSSFTVYATGKDELDITDAKQVAQVCQKFNPKIVLLAAALTNVDFCEENKKLASQVNIEGFKNIAEACKKINASLIVFSTDYVFDGKSKTPYKEKDETHPISHYGTTKLKGEKAVKQVLDNSVIIRTAWLFGEGKKGFVPYVIESIKAKKSLQIISDKIGTPTYVKDLALATLPIIRLILSKRYDFKKYGILHITNSGAGSWYDIAKYIVDYMKVDGITLEKVSLSNYPFKAQRPVYSVLDLSRFEGLTGIQMRLWQDALKEFLQCQKI